MSSLSIEELVKKIGERIYHLRKENNMTQLDLAVKCNIDERQIQRVERGHTSPTLKTLHKIATAFEITISDLLKLEG